MATEKKPSKAAHSRPKSLGLMALKLTYIYKFQFQLNVIHNNERSNFIKVSCTKYVWLKVISVV